MAVTFLSLESMYAVDGAVAGTHKFKYFYQVMNTGNDVDKDIQGVIKYNLANNINVMQNIKNGLYANRLVVHDAFNKTIKTHTFDYYKSFGDYFHSESKKVIEDM